MAVDYDLGTARGRIVIDSSQLGRTSEALRTVGRGMIGLGALAAAGFVVAVKSAADFEKQMSAVGAILQNETAPQMAALKELALDLGSTTVFSAGEIGGAMEALAKAGIPVEDMLNGATQATLNLAAAAGDELPGGIERAAEIISNAQKTFNASAGELEHFADTLVGAAASSTLSVEDLATSFRYAGPIAAELGLSIDDLNTILAILGDRGIKGSTAGTSLRGVLLSLTPSSAKARDALKDLGIITEDGANKFYDLEGNLKSIPEVMQILGDATEGLSEQEKIAAFNAIFQRRAMNAAMIMADQGAEGFHRYADAIAQIDAENVAAEKLNNLSGDITILRNSIETLLIRAGQPFQDMLRDLVQGLTDLVNKIGEVDPETLRLGMQILAVSGAVLILLGSFLIFASWLIRAYRTIMLVKEAFVLLAGSAKLLSASFLLNPWVLLAAAIIAVGVALYAAYRRSEEFRAAFDQAFDHFQPTIEAVFGWLQNFVGLLDDLYQAWQGAGIEGQAFSDVLEEMGLNSQMVVGALVWLREAFVWLKNAAITAFDYFADVILPTLIEVGYTIVHAFQAAISWITGTAIPAIVAFGQAVGRVAMTVVRWIDEHIVPAFVAFGQFIMAVVGLIVAAVYFLWPVFEALASIVVLAVSIMIDIIMVFVDGFIRAWELLGDDIINIWQMLWHFIFTMIEAAFSVIQGIFQFFAGLFTGNWSLLWEGVQNIVSGVWTVITLTLQTAVDAIMALFAFFFDFIRLGWEFFWNLLTTLLVSALTLMVGLLQAAFNGYIGLWSNFIDLVQLAWHNFWNWVGERLSGAWQFIQSVVRNGINAVINNVGTLPSRAANALAGIVNTLVERGQQLIQGLWNGIEQMLTIVNELLGGLPGKFIDWIGDLADTLYDAGKDLIQGLIDGIDAMLGPLDEAVGGVVGAISDVVPGSPVKKGPLRVFNRGEVGKKLMRMLIGGISSESSALAREMATAIDLANPLAIAPSLAGGLGNNNTTNVSISIGSVADGKDLRATLNDQSLLDGIKAAVSAGRR